MNVFDDTGSDFTSYCLHWGLFLAVSVDLNFNVVEE